ncbi:MAG TPA: hypothetical protein VMZ90_06725 [Vicinamibacterales bacterium]|nr:hypothetical protein [Vicinamibacterales bacterium]
MDRGHRSVHYRRLVGVGLMVAFLATAFAPAMAAQQAQPTDSNAFSNKAIAKVVASTKPSPETASLGKDDAAKTPAQAGRSGSFFKTREGVAVLVVLAAGTGYALRSLSKDRIRGAVR